MFCPNCGKEYQDNQNFCRFCGQKLNENSTDLQSYDNTDELSQNTNNSVDLTVENVPVDDNLVDSLSNLNDITEQQCDNNSEKESDCPELQSIGLVSNLKSTLIEDTDKGKKLTPSAIILLVVLALFVVFMANILWSINDAIQINPEMTNENALINIPQDNQDGAYTQAPESQQKDDDTLQTEQKDVPAYAELPQQIEEPPLVPIEEIRQMEQQFPEPEIPTPQEITEESDFES